MNELLPELRIARIEDLSERTGFDEQFLGRHVLIPALDDVETVLLPYTHFLVLMRLDKRLAAVTALGIDGEKLMDLDRSGIDWRLDPRLSEDQQTGERVYARNDIDRGHLVRRASAVWGDTTAEAAQANEDTFHYTNAAPQAAKFNQGLELWLGLETYLLQNAADNGRRLIVFTGPIFSEVDPVYRGVDIPLRFFKVAVFLESGSLAATGYVVDQTPQLKDLPDVPRPGALDDGTADSDDAPPLGPFRTFPDLSVTSPDLPGSTSHSSVRWTDAYRISATPGQNHLDLAGTHQPRMPRPGLRPHRLGVPGQDVGDGIGLT
jgi:DNA/RNA endonuclease G (NUC1)